MSVSKKAINTLILAPLIGMAVLTIQPATYGGDTAYAQSNSRVSSLSVSVQRPNPTRPGTNNSGSEGNAVAGIPPCRPGAAVTPNCRPWTPPTRIVQSEEECTCQMRRVNGVMMKDCYVMLRNLVHYCTAGHLVRK